MIQLDTALIPRCYPFYVAMSGGIDSLAGADLLMRLNKNMRVFHYNHKTRPQNDEMEKAVIKYATDRGIPWDVYYRDEGRPTNEASMREDRMEAFKSLNASIVLCHHLDDAVEGYLLNTIKGCPEYCPIPVSTPLDNSMSILLRPFIRTKKQDFIDYVSYHHLDEYVCEDETNYDSEYCRRNLIRNEVMPTLENMGLRKVVLKKFYL